MDKKVGLTERIREIKTRIEMIGLGFMRSVLKRGARDVLERRGNGTR